LYETTKLARKFEEHEDVDFASVTFGVFVAFVVIDGTG